jgi:hypothetical protein
VHVSMVVMVLMWCLQINAMHVWGFRKAAQAQEESKSYFSQAQHIVGDLAADTHSSHAPALLHTCAEPESTVACLFDARHIGRDGGTCAVAHTLAVMEHVQLHTHTGSDGACAAQLRAHFGSDGACAHTLS